MQQPLPLGSSSGLVGNGGDFRMNNMNNEWHNTGAHSNQQMNHGYNINGNNMNASMNSGNYSGGNSNMGGNGYHNSNMGGNGYQNSNMGGNGYQNTGQGGRFSSNSNSNFGDSMHVPVTYLTPNLRKELNDMRAELEVANESLGNKLKQCQAENRQLVEDKNKAENELKNYKIKSEENVVRLRNKIAQLKEVIADVQYAQEKRSQALTRYVEWGFNPL